MGLMDRAKGSRTQHAFCAIDFPIRDDEVILEDISCVQTLVQGLNTRDIRLRLRGMFVTPLRIRTHDELHIFYGIINRVPLTAKR